MIQAIFRTTGGPELHFMCFGFLHARRLETRRSSSWLSTISMARPPRRSMYVVDRQETGNQSCLLLAASSSLSNKLLSLQLVCGISIILKELFQEILVFEAFTRSNSSSLLLPKIFPHTNFRQWLTTRIDGCLTTKPDYVTPLGLFQFDLLPNFCPHAKVNMVPK